MDKTKQSNAPVSASRRGFFAALAAGVGVTAAALTGKKTEAAEPSNEPVVFKRTAETDRYYKSLTRN